MSRISQKARSPVPAAATSTPASPPATKPPTDAPPRAGWSAASKAGATSAASDPSAAAAIRTAEAFYGAFAARDLPAMAQCYGKDAKFHDPLFKTLHGPEVMDMWKTIMPAANPATFKIEPKVQGEPTPNADGSWNVKVHWDAHYDLGKQHVDNHADSTLVIKEGKIVSQRDEWDLGAWTKQALPFGGGSRAVTKGVSLAAHTFIELKALFEKWKG